MCAQRVLGAGLSGDTPKGPLTRRQKAVFDLFTDPMPDRVEPCLARLASKPPSGDDWAFEVKWDGYRLAVHIGPRRKVRIVTRGGHDWTSRFPTIAHDALELGVDSAIVDGEAVVLDERGASDFGALQKALGGRGGKRFASEAIFYAFDLLYLNGHDLRALGCGERRAILDDTLGIAPHGSIHMSEDINADGAAFLRLACEMDLEGIIAKRRSAPYRSGRGGEWLKIKCVQSESFVIIGYDPSTVALGGVGRLLLAARQGDHLVYVGGVGTGFTHASATALREQMDQLIIFKPAVNMKGRPKSYRWLTPTLVAEIEFRAWTDDGKLRHAAFKGLREEADEAAVYQLS
ncbi:ATP-dependent DNA ligase (plasmid) [Bosea sp. F3-2]|uniref:non-homologous end-joining DNA ligase n=1 Tax=Bosea sp. F3-2 TaxID=2599640 RepID=UPI0011EF7F2B|nr:non-homologous end-joining DNA ligase [Bosea sp. F3-2]QEL26967.1 ATP-dependent DNA ligase [Bosea sp. F3-2]